MTDETDGPVQENKELTSYKAEIPPGITMSELRRAVPASAQVTVTFRTARPNIELSLKDRGRCLLYPNTPYGLNVNANPEGDTYLNPLEPETREFPESSDVPKLFDTFLSQQTTRDKLGLEIEIESPDFDIAAQIDQIVKLKEEAGKYAKAESFYSEQYHLMRARHPELTREVLARNVSGNISAGYEAGYVIFQQAANIAYRQYINNPQQFVDNEEQTQSLFTGGIETVGNAITQSAAEIDNLKYSMDGYEVAFQLNTVGEGNEGVLLMTTYMKDVGWSISAPHAACPAQAASMLDGYLKGTVDETNFPNFTRGIRGLIEQGMVRIEGNTVYLKDKSLINLPHNAEFHGDDTVEHAFETLDYTGNPNLEGQAFKYIMLKDNSETKFIESEETIVINEDEFKE